MLLGRKEKEKLAIKLAEEGKSTSDIPKEVHVSLKDIGKIIHKSAGDDNIAITEKVKERRLKTLSPYARTFHMFKDKKTLADVAIELDIKTDMVLSFHSDYLRLVRMDGLVKIYNDLRNDFLIFFHLYRRIKKEGLSKENIIELVENQQDLSSLKEELNYTMNI